MGCTVEAAENGQKALEIILGDEAGPSDKFGIVFLDNQMVRFLLLGSYLRNLFHSLFCLMLQPVLSGVEMVKRLRELGRKEFIGMAFIYCTLSRL